MAAKKIAGSPKVAIAYIRVSKDDQKLGPEVQREAIEDWAHREGVTIAATFTDHGVCSASEMEDRDGLSQALGALRPLGAGVLLVLKRDRIARDVAIAAAVDKAVRQAGAMTVCVDGAGNGEQPADRFLRQILDAAAEYERALIRGRTKAALGVLKARGERAGTVPYGFGLAEDGKTLIPQPAEQAAVARVQQLRSEGLTLRGIIPRLTQEGYRSRTGQPFQLTQVAKMARRSVAA